MSQKDEDFGIEPSHGFIYTTDLSTLNLTGLSQKTAAQFKLKEPKPGRLCIFKNRLWIPTFTAIDVYSLVDFGMEWTVPLKGVRGVKALCAVEGERLVLAAYSGLYHLDERGNMKTCLHKGAFDDVHSKGSTMAALECEEKELQIWDTTNGKFTFTSKFYLEIDRGFTNTILLNQPHVYATDFDLDTIRKYTMDGNQVEYFGRDILSHPMLCGIDGMSNMLICNRYSSTMKVVSAKGEEVSSMEVTHPTDAVIFKDNLIVFCDGDTVLIYSHSSDVLISSSENSFLSRLYHALTRLFWS